jgi:phosphoribosylformimino-5-aminoimidazole carboxamide ribotide isomerase
MQIVPVIDLMNCLVVRGVAGRRNEYRPVESSLVAGAAPLEIARAFRDTLGLDELYVADLDAIVEARPNRDIYRTLAEEGFRILVDAGLRDTKSAEEVLDAGASALIVGLETSAGPIHLSQLVNQFGAPRVLFSLDLNQGEPLGKTEPWGSSDPLEIVRQAVDAGVERIIVLDLAGVGTSAGVSTVRLCGQLRARFGSLQLITGGGVRHADDLCKLAEIGVDGVLVATALHTGAIGRREIDSLA